MQFTLYSLDDQRARLAALFADGPRHVRLFNYSITHSYAQLSIHDGFPFRRVPLYLMGVYSLCLGSVGALCSNVSVTDDSDGVELSFEDGLLRIQCWRFSVGRLGIARSPEFANWNGQTGLHTLDESRTMSWEYMRGLADRAFRWCERAAKAEPELWMPLTNAVHEFWLLTRAMGNGDVSVDALALLGRLELLPGSGDPLIQEVAMALRLMTTAPK